MAVSITYRPVKTVYIGSPRNVISRYTCSNQPIVYGFAFTETPDAAYRILINIYEAGTNTLLGVRSFKPIYVGENNVDISRFIKPYLRSSFNCDFSQENVAEPETLLRFYITYQEVFSSGSFGDIINDSSNYCNAVLSTKQIGESYGQNLADYTPFGVEEFGHAKFLTDFEQPVAFKGWPFSLSFIYSSEIGGHEIKRIQENLNINGVLVSDSEAQLDTTQINNINHLMLSDFTDSNFVDVFLEVGEAMPETYVYEGYVEEGYTEEL